MDGLDETGRLLADVFGDDLVGSRPYLDWLYHRNPWGEVIAEDLDDHAGRAGHYAVVPVQLTTGSDAAVLRAALSLNTAVHPRAQGAGVFTRLAEATYRKAADQGVQAVVGVANANSTPGFLRRLGFSNSGPLPTRVMLMRPRAGRIESATLTEDVLADDGLWTRLEPLLAPPEQGLATAWTRDSLAWRVRSPKGPYAVHLGSEAAMVSRAARVNGVPVAVAMKILPSGTLANAEARALLRAACAHHRTPLALHSGITDAMPAAGFPVPTRLRPSPLNLIYRPLGSEAPNHGRFATFEFLDFDVY